MPENAIQLQSASDQNNVRQRQEHGSVSIHRLVIFALNCADGESADASRSASGFLLFVRRASLMPAF
jgi:hypothetical protein